MKRRILQTLPATALCLALAGLTTPAVAQQAQQGQQQPGMGQQQMEVDPNTLDTFVDAFVAVQEIRDDFASRLEGVEDQSKAQELQQAAQEEMISAVKDQGMSVEDYNRVAMSLQNDPEMLQKVQEMAQERM
ncbi:DUF4168 domain-containing protein [Ectothiorhodospira mobilis]|jgi:hypothetical protein|uniref:DUF4168 domain-containing protein n=1 Tax=Ectothiorhodospira mobilis TaxID=195064 RepID=UPI001EE8DD65|nr:DUF4168 domain-containing protein [Ectothiorhodospira mobilis]MCG5535903.1 DUF4168 domain-containing protein [Ectothiorhodospira mobilis]